MDKTEVSMEKSQHYVTSTGRRLLITVVCLSVALLAALIVMVGAGLYVASNTNMTENTGQTRKGEVHFTGDKDETDEVEFIEDEHVLIINREGGVFSAHDYKKGLRYIRNPRTYDCYVTPAEHNGLPTYLLNNLGKEIRTSGNRTMDYQLLETAIEDTSFIPSKVRSKCLGRFYWMVEIDAGRVSRAGEHSIEKRATTRTCLRLSADTFSGWLCKDDEYGVERCFLIFYRVCTAWVDVTD